MRNVLLKERKNKPWHYWHLSSFSRYNKNSSWEGQILNGFNSACLFMTCQFWIWHIFGLSKYTCMFYHTGFINGAPSLWFLSLMRMASVIFIGFKNGFLMMNLKLHIIPFLHHVRKQQFGSFLYFLYSTKYKGCISGKYCRWLVSKFKQKSPPCVCVLCFTLNSDPHRFHFWSWQPMQGHIISPAHMILVRRGPHRCCCKGYLVC